LVVKTAVRNTAARFGVRGSFDGFVTRAGYPLTANDVRELPAGDDPWNRQPRQPFARKVIAAGRRVEDISKALIAGSGA
jgi:hypothetical protein